MDKEPQTLQEAIIHFSDLQVCFDLMVHVRWPDGTVKCPRCGRDDVRFLANQQKWECRARHERKQFSIKTGTVFEDSPIKLDKWMTVTWVIVNAKKGISSLEIARAIGVTQKTAWLMLHRIRLAVQTGRFEKLSGAVEVDETFIGGKARNMHINRRQPKIKGTGGTGKAIVLGLLERHGKAQTRSCAEYVHHVIDHAEQYVDGHIHTNGIENFWSLLKRTLSGTYVSLEPYHLFRYLDEQSFRFNGRECSDARRFTKAISGVKGKRLTYKTLTGKDDLPGSAGANALA